MDFSNIPAVSGIYRIVHNASQKCYVGSAVNLHRRWVEHHSRLCSNTHPNPHLQRAWKKHGAENFTFEILEIVLIPEMLTAREQAWLGKLNPFGKKGYNIAPTAGSRLGLQHTPEACAKMSQTRKGKKTGSTRIITPEMRAKISSANKGRQTWLGRTHRPESIEKIRAKKTGRKPEPKEYEHRMKAIIAISPEGQEYHVRGIKAFCKEHQLDNAALVRVLKGKVKQHKGWTARYADLDAETEADAG